MLAKTFVGWILLGGGLAIILLSLISSYNIFTGKEEVPQVFKETVEKETAKIQPQKTKDFQTQIQQTMQQALSEQLSQVLPQGTITKLLNLTCWSVMTFIFIFAGSQISSLGIKLLK